MRDLNPRPTACKADALTAAPIAHLASIEVATGPVCLEGCKGQAISLHNAVENDQGRMRFGPRQIGSRRVRH